MSLQASASQTVGPFFSIGLSWLYKGELIAPAHEHSCIAVEGRVLDGDQRPIPDAVLELWQADAEGRYADPHDAQSALRGFGRVATDEQGGFRFTTIKPGRVPGPDGVLQAPHVSVLVFMRGLLKPVRTRLYFPDEAANAEDPVLLLVPPSRQRTLIARPASGSVLHWDVHVQGDDETVFFDY